jgi:hypothetical protein
VRRVERFRRRLSERQELGPGSTCGRGVQRWAPHEEMGEWWDLEGAGSNGETERQKRRLQQRRRQGGGRGEEKWEPLDR